MRNERILNQLNLTSGCFPEFFIMSRRENGHLVALTTVLCLVSAHITVTIFSYFFGIKLFIYWLKYTLPSDYFSKKKKFRWEVVSLTDTPTFNSDLSGAIYVSVTSTWVFLCFFPLSTLEGTKERQ